MKHLALRDCRAGTSGHVSTTCTLCAQWKLVWSELDVVCEANEKQEVGGNQFFSSSPLDLRVYSSINQLRHCKTCLD